MSGKTENRYENCDRSSLDQNARPSSKVGFFFTKSCERLPALPNLESRLMYIISLIHDVFSDFTVDPKISLIYDGLSGEAANFSLIYDGLGGEAAKLIPLQSLSLIYDVIYK